LITRNAGPDSIGGLLDHVRVDLDNLAPQAKRGPDLDFYGLDLSVRPSRDVDHPSEVLVIVTEHLSTAQIRYSLP
jgi:hypothetical protein